MSHLTLLDVFIGAALFALFTVGLVARRHAGGRRVPVILGMLSAGGMLAVTLVLQPGSSATHGEIVAPIVTSSMASRNIDQGLVTGIGSTPTQTGVAVYMHLNGGSWLAATETHGGAAQLFRAARAHGVIALRSIPANVQASYRSQLPSSSIALAATWIGLLGLSALSLLWWLAGPLNGVSSITLATTDRRDSLLGVRTAWLDERISPREAGTPDAGGDGAA